MPLWTSLRSGSKGRLLHDNIKRLTPAENSAGVSKTVIQKMICGICQAGLAVNEMPCAQREEAGAR